jgi:hypothetical protein
MRHEDTLVELCGEDLAVEDLRYLRQEDLDQIAATMSFVEARRLNDGIEQLKKSTLASAQSEDFNSAVRLVCARGSPSSREPQAQQLLRPMEEGLLICLNAPQTGQPELRMRRMDRPAAACLFHCCPACMHGWRETLRNALRY